MGQLLTIEIPNFPSPGMKFEHDLTWLEIKVTPTRTPGTGLVGRAAAGVLAQNTFTVRFEMDSSATHFMRYMQAKLVITKVTLKNSGTNAGGEPISAIVYEMTGVRVKSYRMLDVPVPSRQGSSDHTQLDVTMSYEKIVQRRQ